MARGRLISRCVSTSRKFGTLPTLAGELAEFCQKLYLLIIPHTDDFGRMSADAWTIKFQVDPSSARSLDEFSRALSYLESAGLVQIYTGNDAEPCLQVVGFDPHQPGLHKRTASKFPEPPGNSRKFPEIPSEQNRTEQKGTERNGTEQTQKAATPQGVGASLTGSLSVHRSHASCGRVCVPAFIHDELKRQLGGDEAESEVRLRAFYTKVHDAWSDDGPHAKDIPGDAPAFWRSQFAISFNPNGTKSAGKSRAEAERIHKLRMGCRHTPKCASYSDCIDAIQQEIA